ncbi:MAG TPA: archaetidylserine decarboxylase [Pirellulales bacterium]|nr:archaetidylserine decarboxylase [Pirellulales bacterium]
MRAKFKTRVEQIRQARRIHGGLVNLWAATVGVKLSRVPIPSRRLRERLYRRIYGSKYAALCEDELERPLAEFRSLNELFTRGVRAERRPVAQGDGLFVCPCDGMVQEIGRLQQGALLTAKGVRYTLSSLLPGVDWQPFEDGAYAVLFLSPADCHRVFSPSQAALEEVIHVPGRRLLVHPPFQRAEFPVFVLNERVIMRFQTPLRRYMLVLVAGWGVGNITHPWRARPKHSRRRITRRRFESPRDVASGEWVATFELGSTVILIAESHGGVVSHIERDKQVHYGEPLFTFGVNGDEHRGEIGR